MFSTCSPCQAPLRRALPFLSRVNRAKLTRCWLVLALVCVVVPLAAWGFPNPTPTITLLTVNNSSHNPVGEINYGAAVTLTARVVDVQGNPLPFGTVVFCDGATAPCVDGHNLGSAQLVVNANSPFTAFDTASITIVPNIGTHSYRAIYLGVSTNAITNTAHPGSTSAAHALTVLGTRSLPTTTTIAKTGTVGNYSLTATVVGTGSGSLKLTGDDVNFVDTTNANFLLGSAALGSTSFARGFSPFTFPALPPAVGILSAVGDFNHDGLPDLILIVPDFQNPVNYDVAVFLNTGNGTFGNPSYQAGIIPTGDIPFAIAVGDFNNDDNLDLAISTLSGFSPKLYVFQGSGTGLFGGLGSPITTYEIVTSMVVGDFNNSGNQSIAGLTADSLFFFQGSGTGALTPAGGQLLGGSPTAIAAGDFLGNGFLSLAVTDSGSNTVNFFVGMGTNTFSPAIQVPVGHGPDAMVVADFNGDGFADIAVANSGDHNLTILLGAANLVYTPKSTPATGPMPAYLALGNFSGTGNFDLAVGNAAGTSMNLLLGKGDGTFTAGTPFSFSNPLGISAADFNNDGITDLAAINDQETTLFLSYRTATAKATLTGVDIAGTGIHQVAAAYQGDSNYQPSTSGTVPLTTQITPTALQLTALPGTSNWGQQVALTATLTPYTAQGLATNGELVTFYDGITKLGTGKLALGVATLNIGSFSVGLHNLKASYGGDGNFGPSTSVLTYKVTAAASTTVLTAATKSPTIGTPDLLTATVTGFSSPRGNVLFTAGGKLLCKVALGATGKATCSWTPTGTQKVTLVATYTGDNDYAGSWGTLDLTPAFGYDPNVTMNFNSTTLTYPGATNVTICVARATSVAATGVVEILDNGNMLTALTLGGDGCAYWYINPGLDAGHHHLQAFYFGDSHNLGGYSTIADVTVNPVTTQMEVSCWNSSFPVGGDYTCQVSTWSNAGSPPGNINYSYDGGPVHHASLSNGNTLFVISHPAVGHHTVAIAYPGTQNYSATPINTQYFTVTP